MSTYLITGTSRGIGLELTSQLLSQPSTSVAKVIAVTRTSSTALNILIDQFPDRLINLQIQHLNDETIVQQAVVALQEKHGIDAIDVLINNAGVMKYHPDGIRTMSADDLRGVLETNVISVQVVTAAFLPLLERGREKKVINMSSTLGSMTMASHFAVQAPAHGYKISKTALNMLNLQWALEYQGKGFTFLNISPGWLKSDLGSEYADLPVPTGVKAVLDIVFAATPDHSGKHLNIKVEGWGPDAEDVKDLKPNVYDGGDIAW